MPWLIGFFFYAGICLDGFGLANAATYRCANADPAFANCLIDRDRSIPIP